MAEPEEQAKEEPKKSSKLKLLIIVVLILAIGGGGGFFAYLKFFKKTEETPSEEVKKPEHQPIVAKLDTFLVNLSDPGGKRYLKLTMELELESPKVDEEVKQEMSKIRDNVLVILSSKEFDDISSVNGKLALKKEILSRLNTILKKGKVLNVYFTEFLVQ